LLDHNAFSLDIDYLSSLFTICRLYWHRTADVIVAMPRPSGVRWSMKKGWCQATGWGQCFDTVGWGDRKGIRPVKTCHLSLKILFRKRWRKKWRGTG